MTIKLFISIITLLIVTTGLTAQQIDSVMSLYADSFESEKIHMHTDRADYRPGETVFYKIYIFTNSELSTLSKIIYTDCYDENGNLLMQTQAPLILSGAKGSFTIPADYKGKILQLKAYTKWMLNFDTAFLYSKSVAVVQPGHTSFSVPKKNFVTHVQLYPEGGYSVAGITNRIAFKAVDQWGNPVYIKAVIKDNKDISVDSIIAEHDGMGAFLLNIKKEDAFSFNWADDNGNAGKIDLKAQKQSGACLKVMPSGKKILFTVDRSPDAANEFKIMHLLVHRNHSLRYKVDINMIAKTIISAEFILNDLPSGIVQFTLFTDNWLPVAERIIFVNNQTHKFYPKINITQKDLSKKGFNKIEIIVSDTVLTNMSVAVTEASLADVNGPNIFADFLLSDEIRGRVNNPDYYFSNDAVTDTFIKKDKFKDSVLAAHLDLVMLTHGHRQYNWEQITSGKIPAIKYPADTSYLKIMGQLMAKRLLKSKDPLLVNIMLHTKDSVKTMFVLPVNRVGSFEKPDLFFYDSAKLFYSLSSGKNTMGAIKIENSFLGREERYTYFKKSLTINSGTISNPEQTYKKIKFASDSTFYIEQTKKIKLKALTTLQELKVTAKIRTPKQVLDDYYTRGMYSGEGNNYAIDVEGDITSGRYSNIFLYLQTKVPGLRVDSRDAGNPLPVWYPNSQGVPDVPAFLLDEVPITLESLNSIDINSIAFVKAFKPPFLGSMLNGFSGVIGLYSKRGYSPIHDKESGEGLESVVLQGYTRFKEFSQPNYDELKIRQEEDYRSTLYWNPYVLTDRYNRDAIIEFYNNDISKKLCLVLEGVNADGKMTRVVKLIE